MSKMRIEVESFPVNSISCVFIVHVHVDEGYVSYVNLPLRMFVCILQFDISVFLRKKTGINVCVYFTIINFRVPWKRN